MLAAFPALTVKLALVALARVVAVAVSLYPSPARSIAKSSKLAVPLTASLTSVPVRRAPDAPVPAVIATVILTVELGTMFPWPSCATTCTTGLIAVPATAVLGWTAKASLLANGAPTAT
jgi:hypothetical protein